MKIARQTGPVILVTGYLGQRRDERQCFCLDYTREQGGRLETRGQQPRPGPGLVRPSVPVLLCLESILNIGPGAAPSNEPG